MMGRKKVDFIGIGAQKAGTTWLYFTLNNIPGFSLPYEKELNYFSRSPEYGHGFLKHKYFLRRIIKPIRTFRMFKHLIGIKGKEEFNWYFNWYFSNYTDKWYLSLFDKCQGIKGEITPNYSILSVSDIRKISDLIPKVKIIFLIRNPIDRCISHYYDIRSRNNKNFHERKFNFDDFYHFANSEQQEIRSNYLKTLDNYRKVFPEEQILVCFFDAIKEKPDELLIDIFSFLGYKQNEPVLDLIIKNKVNASKKAQIPDRALSMLKDKYRDFIKELSEEFGGYCTKWFNDLNGDETNSEKLLPTASS